MFVHIIKILFVLCMHLSWSHTYVLIYGRFALSPAHVQKMNKNIFLRFGNSVVGIRPPVTGKTVNLFNTFFFIEIDEIDSDKL